VPAYAVAVRIPATSTLAADGMLMHIERIEIQNFKLFDRRSFEFHPRFNLVVGINGSGKTSLLKAIAKTLSTMMRNVGKEFPLEERDVRIIRKAVSKELRFETNHRIDIFAKLAPAQSSIRAHYKRPNHGLMQIADGNELLIKQLADRLKKNAWETLPLILFFPCNRYWLEHGDKTVNAIDAATEKQSRLAGYETWHEASADYPAFQRWIVGKTLERLQEIAEIGTPKQGEEIEDELFLVSKAVASCIENAKEIRYDFKQKSILLEWANDQFSLFDDLSDGQRTLLAMVADIARRACLLNPHLGSRVLEETPGIVLIDELDLHLHPKWQRRIIGDLRRTFPQIQFICTTHSPQLIGQCKPEEIILLDTPEEAHPGQSYGMDSNWILRHVMDSDDRDPVIAEKLDAIFEAIEEAEFEKAEAAVAELRGEIGEHPDLVEAEALIGRYTRLPETGEE
jgi:predicted ATP-binding protein involved in virulence